MRRLLFLAFASIFATGCYGGHAHHHHIHHGGGDVAFAAGVGLLAGVAIAEAAHDHDPPPPPQPVYYQPVVYVNAPPQPASPRDQVPSNSDGPAFDAKAARTALGAVDLATCRDVGAPRGYGHAKVTFNPDGKASKVVVDTPDNMNARAVQCIGDRLGAVSIPEYQGSLVTVGTTWFVP